MTSRASPEWLRFETLMLDRLRASHPVDAQLAGREHMARFVRFGVERAQRYGFTNGPAVWTYLNVMMLFGAAFDEDPLLPWATDLLLGKTKGSADGLWAGALTRHAQIGGKHFVQALIRAKSLVLPPFPFTDEKQAASLLATLYPQKFELTKHRLPDLIAAIPAEWKGLEARPPALHPLRIVLMFLLGTYFDQDPRFRWASAILSDRKEPDMGRRMKRLEVETKAQLAKALDLLRGGGSGG